jgi:Fe-S-cluster containining protein
MTCERCGECCRSVTIPIKLPGSPALVKEALEFYRERGFEIVRLPGGWGWGAREAKPCPHLEGSLCSIQDHKPGMCRRASCPKGAK